jgi:glycerol-3-phosphate dehydrogenase (NAD+)
MMRLGVWSTMHSLPGRYLPGIKLPANVVAEPDLLETVKDAHLLVWVLPHQVPPP